MSWVNFDLPVSYLVAGDIQQERENIEEGSRIYKDLDILHPNQRLFIYSLDFDYLYELLHHPK
jgi:hypothetical protein